MSGEPLVVVPGATVYEVERTSHAVTSIANGDFVIAYAAPGDDAGLQAQVGPVRWPLGRWVATLRFDDHVYAFQLPPGHGSCYYCLTLQPDTPLELLDLLQAILASGSAYHDQQRVAGQPPLPADLRALQQHLQQPQQQPQGQQQQPRQQQQQQAPNKADRLAAGLQRGGQLAAAGVLTAAAWAGGALHRGAEAAVARMQPSDRQHSLSPEAQARLQRAQSIAASAAEVSGRAVSGALSMTAKVAGALVQRISSTDLARQLSNGHLAGASAQDMRKVGVAGVDAIEAVYDSLADAARIVLAHTHAAATRVAGHKYGPGAAQATSAGIQVTQSVVETGLHMYKLRPTALAKKAMKGAAQSVVLGNGRAQGEQLGMGAGPAGSGGSSIGGPTPGPGPAPQRGAWSATVPGPTPWPGPAPQPQPGSAPSRASVPVLPPAPGPASGQWPPPPGPGPAWGPSPAAPVAAAVETLAALTEPPHAEASYGGISGPSYGGGGGGGGGGAVVDGLAVSGPVAAHPVLVDYTPSVAVLDGTGAGSGAGPALPYPAVSPSQYTARYYPAVPRG